jgi:hypothetical protein
LYSTEAVAECGTTRSESTEKVTRACRRSTISIASTDPTTTPAIRTSSPLRSPLTSVNTAE